MAKGSSSTPKIKPNQAKNQNRNISEVQKYFSGINNLPKKDQVTQLETQTLKGICKKIQQGKVTITQEPTNLTVFFQKQKQKEQLRIKKQKQKQQQIERKKQQFKQEIMRLDMRQKKSIDESKAYTKQYGNPDLLKYKPNSVLTRQEHENLVLKVSKAQQDQNKKRQQYIQKLHQNWKQEQENEKKEGQEKIRSQRQKRKVQIQKKLSIRKQMNQKLQSLQAKNNKQLLQIKHKKFLHEKLESQYHSQVIVPSLEEKKKKLRQIRQLSRGFSVQQLNQHQKQYLKRRNNSGHHSRFKVSQEWQYKAPVKGQKLNKILQEEIAQRKQKIDHHKNSQKQKKLRLQNFANHMKQKNPPKVSIKLQNELQERILNQKTKVRETTADSRVIGNNYLSEAKLLAKKISRDSRPGSSEIQQQYIKQSLQKRSYSNYLQVQQDDVYYQEKKRKKLENLLKSNQDKVEKAKQLELETKKISEEIARKKQLIKYQKNSNVQRQTAELMVTNLRAKMGLIDIYNKSS